MSISNPNDKGLEMNVFTWSTVKGCRDFAQIAMVVTQSLARASRDALKGGGD